ncbi:alpha-amylase family protein [Corynebacterium pilosum]|uniref:Putative cyclomaltodextrinase or neopullalanase n=1 Tax=Corynebacterium pilosum TaxID=35756 RepID=A0A376CM30_9CORY|nr:alpha-amylase family protein [Corynebacterium pilosum]STC69322.1 putative cyclomaltodextrinase or neopullalanase [Corynebacterium pilosum]
MLESTIWWHVYPLGSSGAPIRDREGDDSGHRLRSLEPWLDYLIELGCNGLLLGPIFESATHGYDTLDHFRIDSRLGTNEDFDALMQACNEKGIRVMLDGVFNHVDRNHPAVAEGLAGDTNWEGHDQLATLHHDDQRVRDKVVEIMEFWLTKGISGWRLDVAYSVPADFWREVLGRVRQNYPDAIFLGEVIHGDYAQIAEAGTLDSVTQYELWKAIWSSIKDVNFFELAHALGRHSEFSEHMITNTFVGNHDVNRIASTVGQDHVIPAVAMLMTLPGSPSIYCGDEQGFTGLRGEGFAADDPVRPPLPATPSELADEGRWLLEAHKALIAVRRRHAWLATATLEVVDTANETISYVVSNRENAEEKLQVDVWLEPQPGVRIHAGDQTEYQWQQP